MEVTSLVTELDERPAQSADLPESPVPGLEPLLTLDQLSKWTGYSLAQLYKLRNRKENPLPMVGTEQRPRAVPSKVLIWMEEEYARSMSA